MKIVLVLVGIAVFGLIVVGLLRAHRSARPEPGPADTEPSRDVAALIAPLRRNSALLRPTDGESRSYLGGLPPGFEGFTWPARDGRPLAFLACIDLSKVENIEWLPQTGLLLYFYDVEEQPWGFDPKDRGGWAVLYVSDATPTSGLTEAPESLSAAGRLPRRSVSLHSKTLAPSWDHPVVEDLRLSDVEEDALTSLRDVDYGDFPRHQMGGFPDPIQNADMGLECQLASHGLYVGDATGYAHPRAQELKAGASDWRLFLQLDSDDALDVMWGDAGMLYFWVREQDARRSDFSGTWLVLQCY